MLKISNNSAISTKILRLENGAVNGAVFDYGFGISKNGAKECIV